MRKLNSHAVVAIAIMTAHTNCPKPLCVLEKAKRLVDIVGPTARLRLPKVWLRPLRAPRELRDGATLLTSSVAHTETARSISGGKA